MSIANKFKIRDLLLIIYSAGWSAAVGVSLIKTGEVSATLFAALGIGVGTIIGAFRVETVGAAAQREQQPAGGSTDSPTTSEDAA